MSAPSAVSRDVLTEPVLSADDRAFFERNGYVIVKGAVPAELCDRVVDAIWSFLGMDRHDPATWYRGDPLPNGMIEMYQHQAMWDARQYPRVHRAFADLWGNDRLWVTLDRVNMKPPRHPDHPAYDHKGFIHWDADTDQPVPFGVQGVLYLADTSEDMGGFQCVPELFRRFDDWVKTQPADRNPRQPDLTGFAVEPIAGNKGDLVIWHKLLAHGNGHNVSARPRLAQYISMFPTREDNEELRQDRINRWKNRLPQRGKPFPGDPQRREELHGTTAELTPLGRRLLGLDKWG